MTVVTPLQPLAGGGAVQENFRQMVDHVLSYNPDCPPQLAKRRINTRLRQVQDRRMWGGLLIRGEIYIPAAYSTGTVTTVTGSDVVTGAATAWPWNDMVNTTMSAVTVVNELQDITPVSMANISPGDFLLVSQGLADEEYLLVYSIKATSFRARPTQTHLAASTLNKSSLVGRQFRLGTVKPFYTIKGITQAQGMKIELPWSHLGGTNQAYQVVQAYVSMEPNLRMVWSVVNTAQGWRLRLNMPQDVLNTYDAWRQTTGWVYMLTDYIPDMIGRFRYELYPTPSMEQGFPYLAYRTVPNLEDDEDTPPPCIPSHVLVHGAIADVLVYNPKSPYYDPGTSKMFMGQYSIDLEQAVMADDSIYMQNLMWSYGKYPFSQMGSAYWQSHDYEGVMGVV